MDYVDGFVAAVPEGNRQTYIDHAQVAAAIFRRCGATRVVECWGDDVPEGKLTSFPMAVKREAGEVVVFSWVCWPSKEVRDAGWKTMMEDPDMAKMELPFDGKRMIYGGFQMVLDA